MKVSIGVAAVIFIVGLVGGGTLVSFLKPNPHAWMLVGIMLIGGLIGGSVNYFLSKSDDPEGTSVAKSLIVGIGAALLVPLFLNMLSSNLLFVSRTEPLAMLVFLGFCLIAAISSKAFITTISDRVLKEVKEAKQQAAEAQTVAGQASDVAGQASDVAAQASDVAGQAADVAGQAVTVAEQTSADVAPIVEKETEPEPEDPASGGDGEFESMGSTEPPVDLNEFERQVLSALGSSSYTLRSTGGIVRDVQPENDAQVRNTLNELTVKGLVRQGRDRDLWYLTTEGRRVLARL